jgi:beta-lactam-binding protein with PASTA domain
MHHWRRHAATGTGAVLAVVLASCSSSPSGDQGQRADRSTTTVTVTAITSSTTSTQPGVTVPNVIGLRIAAARVALRDVGLPLVDLNKRCTKGTLASQSVVDSLALPGKAPTPNVGAVPVEPGSKVPPGSRIGITWSGCYGNVVLVPDVVGESFAVARHALSEAGLTWACYSVGRSSRNTTTTTSATTTTASVTTATAVAPLPRGIVLTQDPQTGGMLRPGATVTLTMRVCPQ